MRRLFLLVLLIALTGCSKSGNERGYDLSVRNAGDGTLTLNVYFGIEVDSDASSGGASTSVAPKTNLGLNGSTPTMSGTSAALEAVESVFTPKNTVTDDNSVHQPNPTTVLPAVAPPEIPASGEMQTRVFTLKEAKGHGRNMVWFEGITAADWNGWVKFSDSCGADLIVADPKYRFYGPEDQHYYSGEWESEGVPQRDQLGNTKSSSYMTSKGCTAETVTATWYNK